MQESEEMQFTYDGIIKLKDLRFTVNHQIPYLDKYRKGEKFFPRYVSHVLLKIIYEKEKVYGFNDITIAKEFLKKIYKLNIVEANKLYNLEYSKYLICYQIILILNNDYPIKDIFYVNKTNVKIIVSVEEKQLKSTDNNNQISNVTLDWDTDIEFQDGKVIFKYPLKYRKENNYYKDISWINNKSSTGLNYLISIFKNRFGDIKVTINDVSIYKFDSKLSIKIEKVISDLIGFEEELKLSNDSIESKSDNKPIEAVTPIEENASIEDKRPNEYKIPIEYKTQIEYKTPIENDKPSVNKPSIKKETPIESKGKDQQEMLQRLHIFKNKYFEILILHQVDGINIIRCHEKIFYLLSANKIEEGFIFTIEEDSYNYKYVYESVNIKRASLQFYAPKTRWKDATQEISNFMAKLLLFKRTLFKFKRFNFIKAGIWKYKSVNHV